MWIFKWAFRFPTCTQTGAQKGPLGTWLLPNPVGQGILGFLVSPRGRAPFLTEAQVPALEGKPTTALQSTILGGCLSIHSGCCVPTLGRYEEPAVLAQEGAHLVELLVTVRALVLLVSVMSLQVAHLGGGVGE